MFVVFRKEAGRAGKEHGNLRYTVVGDCDAVLEAGDKGMPVKIA